MSVSDTKRLTMFFEKIKNFFLDSPLLIVAMHQVRQSILSRRFILIMLALVLPLVVQLIYEPAPVADSNTDLKDFYEPFEAKYVLNLFSPMDVEQVPFGNIASLLFIIFLILTCSEFLAQEYEEKTISILLVKPLRRSDIIFGKLMGFIFLLGTLEALILLGHSIGLTWQMQASTEALMSVILFSLPLILGTFMLGLAFMSSFMMALSAFFNKGLHAALTGILIFFGDEIFVRVIVGTEYRLAYQLGVIIEEFIAISNESLYSGDYLFSFNVIVILITSFLLFTLIVFFRREFP